MEQSIRQITRSRNQRS